MVVSLSTAKPTIGQEMPVLYPAIISKKPLPPSSPSILSPPLPLSKSNKDNNSNANTNAGRSSLSSPSSPSSLSSLTPSSSNHNAHSFILLSSDDHLADDEKKIKGKRKEKGNTSPSSSSSSSSSLTASSSSASSLSSSPQITSSTNATFMIPRKSTIMSNHQPHKVTIGIIALSADFIYRSIPKLSKYAYLNVSSVNSSEFPLLSGLCSVFFDNSFVSSTLIADISPGEKLDFSIGVDEKIHIKYKTIRQLKEEKGIFTKTNNETHEFLTVIKNTKSIEVKVRVYDQLPRSLDEKLKVKMITPNLNSVTYVKLDQITNNLEWEFNVPAGARVRVPFSYELEWPKDKYLIDGSPS